MRIRRAIGWALLGAVLVLAGAGAALLARPQSPPPPGPEPGRSLYRAHCATCHGSDGRGDSWRARLLLLAPGDLTTPAAAALPEPYLTDIVRHGGATFGKPGMPSFGFVLSEADIAAVVEYVRTLPRAAGAERQARVSGRPGPAR
jgi:mono/diheme cytochrome c family protein